ncbi:MAG: DUF21 domain-containing protein [Spartobacteria bacterium]|nr:DUF21 domain-containing protein [Spartobacteria bacterium]
MMNVLMIAKAHTFAHAGLSVWIFSFVGAIICSTLHSAFAATGVADAARLAEKYPKSSRHLEKWVPRWDMLRKSALSLSMLMNVLAVLTAVPLLTPNGGTVLWPHWLAAGLVALLLFPLGLFILPHALAAGFADRISIVFLPVVILLCRILWPLSWLLVRSERFLLAHLLKRSDEDDHPTPEEAIRSLVNRADAIDLDEEEREIIRSVFEFGETITREIMVPRIDMEGMEDLLTIEACVKRTQESRHSRFPVFHESMDDIQGIVHVKDLLHQFAAGYGTQRIISIAKTVPFVPESMPINDLLQLLRNEQAQMAVVVDEYGGTAGLVTVEDIIEELVGEIEDEYDVAESAVRRLSDGSSILDARLSVDEANELLGVHVPTSDEYDSLGGYVFHALGRIPRAGETMAGVDFRITVQTASPRRLHNLRIQKL